MPEGQEQVGASQCPACNGEGYVMVEESHRSIAHNCDACEGTGSVPVYAEDVAELYLTVHILKVDAQYYAEVLGAVNGRTVLVDSPVMALKDVLARLTAHDKVQQLIDARLWTDATPPTGTQVVTAVPHETNARLTKLEDWAARHEAANVAWSEQHLSAGHSVEYTIRAPGKVPDDS